MINLHDVFMTVDELTDEQKQLLMDYLRRSTVTTGQLESQPRIFNMHPNAMIMSEDFDDELPVSFWFSEE